MSLEAQNTKKRKLEPLTNSEWLTFFFLPSRKLNSWEFGNTYKFNEIEETRFNKYRFERKQKESSLAGTYGYI